MQGFLLYQTLMKRNFILLASCFLAITAHAQFSGGGSSLPDNLDNSAYVNVKGRPYIPMAFGRGYCLRFDGKKDTLLARLDTHLQHVEVFDHKTGRVSLRQGAYRQCQLEVIDEGLLLFRTGFPAIGKLTEGSWYQVLHDGKTKLLKHTAAIIQNECYDYGGIRQPCFKNTETYYLQAANKQLVNVDKGEQLWAFFGPRQAEMETLAKQRKLKIKRWDHVSQLLQAFDSL